MHESIPLPGISRRALIQGGAGLGLLALTPAVVRGDWKRFGFLEPRLTRSTFLPLVGRTMQMSVAGSSVGVVLHEVGDLTPVRVVADEHRFALRFVQTAGDRPGQVSYDSGSVRTFSHPSIGRVSLFAAEVQKVDGQVIYEAVVNNRATGELNG